MIFKWITPVYSITLVVKMLKGERWAFRKILGDTNQHFYEEILAARVWLGWFF